MQKLQLLKILLAFKIKPEDKPKVETQACFLLPVQFPHGKSMESFMRKLGTFIKQRAVVYIVSESQEKSIERSQSNHSFSLRPQNLKKRVLKVILNYIIFTSVRFESQEKSIESAEILRTKASYIDYESQEKSIESVFYLKFLRIILKNLKKRVLKVLYSFGLHHDVLFESQEKSIESISILRILQDKKQ